MALIPPQIDSQETNRELTLANYATQSGIYAQTAAAIDNATALGRAFDAAKNDDTFYLPPEVFDNPDFKRGLKLFLSPDGKAARMIVTHEGDPATPEGISHIDPITKAAHEALKGTPMADAQIYIGGTAATYKDIQDGAKYDLMIVAFAALSLILLIMMIITRSLIAALVIVGTVALSLGASFGLSVLVWQYLFGIQLYWVVLALAVILLLAVGSDYNLLLISRFKEEIHAGLKTGVIRAMAGSGSVVTSAGIVFAVTMCAFVFSGFQVLGQIGTTIGLGLLFDTLIVRSFMTPSVATLLGRWFWWPQRVRPRPASTMLRPYGPRSAVRQLLLWEDDDPAVASEDALTQHGGHDAGQVAQPGHLGRPEFRARTAQHHRRMRVAQRRGDHRGVHVAPRLRHPVGGAVQRRGLLDRQPWRRNRPGLRRTGLAARRCSSPSELRNTVHQLTRNTLGASSARTCSLASLSPAAATRSRSSSSRCASSRPVCGRTLSTRTPGSDSAAVIKMSGIAPRGSSMTRSSIA